MRIAVLNNWVPFIRGGAEHLADGLVTHLQKRGHEALLVRLPFQWHPPERVIEHILACRSVRLDNVDRVIGLKFPAYHVPHPNKVMWLLHQFRQAYDLWGTPHQDLPGTPAGRRIREIVIDSDRRFLPEYRRIYTISPVASDRMKRFSGLDSEVLFHPLLDPEGLRCDRYGDAVFFPSRITAGKRQYLAVEAMKHVKTAVRLIVAGAPETPAELERLEQTVATNGLADRVQILPRFIEEQEKRHLFATCLACVYLPYDEDSYGYVTLEACHCRKPIVTCTDSGGVLILARVGESAFVVPPDPPSLAEALDRLYLDRALARRMGEAAYECMKTLKITWDNVVEKLTA